MVQVQHGRRQFGERLTGAGEVDAECRRDSVDEYARHTQ